MERDLTSIHCAGSIVLKDGKLLLAFSKNKDAFYLPGRKVDAECLDQDFVWAGIYGICGLTGFFLEKEDYLTGCNRF